MHWPSFDEVLCPFLVRQEGVLLAGLMVLSVLTLSVQITDRYGSHIEFEINLLGFAAKIGFGVYN